MKNENLHINIDLITRYLSKEASQQEIALVETWIQENTENKKLFEEYKLTWENLDNFKERTLIDIDKEWEKLNEQIEAKKFDAETKKSFFYTFSRIAAILVIILITGAGIAYVSDAIRYESFSTSNEIAEITLPDNSIITLNVNSKIKYLKKFDDVTREISLKGEAFFDVQKDSLRPFIINASNAIVEVLGTSFNIKAYKENEIIEVAVSTGKVKLSEENHLENSVVLNAGEIGELNKKKRKLRQAVNTDNNHLAWKTKELIFENTPFIEVIDAINNAYNTNIVIRSPKAEQCKITSTFTNKSLDAILAIFENTLDIQIERTDDLIIIKGEGC